MNLLNGAPYERRLFLEVYTAVSEILLFHFPLYKYFRNFTGDNFKFTTNISEIFLDEIFYRYG